MNSDKNQKNYFVIFLFLQFTCPAKVPSGCFCGRLSGQVGPKSLTCPGESRSAYLGEVLPGQVNCRKSFQKQIPYRCSRLFRTFTKIMCIPRYEKYFQIYHRNPRSHRSAGRLCSGNHPPSSDSKPATPLTEGSRIIAVSFGEQTKTTLGSGLQPQFEDGDWITVSNNEASEYRQVSVDDNGNATFSTDLEGLLTAVYPKDAAEMEGDTIVGIKVPAKQDGSFANANICMAEMKAEKGESLTFENKTALFIVTPPEGVETFTVRSLNTIDKTLGQRSSEANAAFINTDGATEDAKRVIDVTAIDSDGKAYVAIAVPATGAVNLSDLSFEAETNKSSGWIKGIAPNDIKARATALGKSYEAFNTVAVGTAYTLESGWHEYVTVAGEKWATMNVGATEENIYGAHFAWGDVVGQFADYSIEPGQYGERENAFPQNFIAPPSIVGDIVNLPLEYDAAYANWGGGWRMPSGYYGEYKDLLENTTGTWKTVEGVSGLEIVDNNAPDNHLFFPAAGYGQIYGQINYLLHANLEGVYWSSSLLSNPPNTAQSFGFNENNNLLSYMDRVSGLSIRPIYDPTPAPEEPLHDILPGVFTVSDNGTPEDKSDDVKVQFSEGNLYCSRPSAGSDDWSWHFFSEQYGGSSSKLDSVSFEGEIQHTDETDLNISLFTWGYDPSKSVKPAGTEYVTAHPTDGEKLVSEVGGDDWGVAYRKSNRRTTVNWRTLTNEEWQFLLSYDPTKFGKSGPSYDNAIRRGKFRKNVCVCGVQHCIVLLPDDWDENVISLEDFAEAGGYGNAWGDSPTWNQMEEAGAVCIPYTAIREGDSVKKNYQGFYWSSTAAGDDKAYTFGVGYDSLPLAFTNGIRSTGCSVRLVTECK